MSNVQTELDELRAVYGTGEDTRGLLGKTVKATEGNDPFFAAGTTGTVVLIDGDGFAWVDWGAPTCDGLQIWSLDARAYTIVE